MKQKLDQFKAADYTFADARECKFVEKLCEVRFVLCCVAWRCVAGVRRCVFRVFVCMCRAYVCIYVRVPSDDAVVGR